MRNFVLSRGSNLILANSVDMNMLGPKKAIRYEKFSTLRYLVF